ncbi:MAG TPA: NAD(P)/FAD-dependent oxidoreductase [Streptosporangiaceae bacterium]
MNGPARRRVVIVGGGFGGLFAVRALRRGPFSITLIDQSEHHLFQPLLYQCATGILSEGQITAPLRRVLRHEANVECVMARAVDVDPRARKVICHRPLGSRLEADYDYLIVAAGVEQSYFGHDEFRALAPGMKTIADALTIRRRVFGAFEMAETAPNAVERTRWLTFALVGAGPTGVELAGQIRELATKTLHEEFRRAHPEDARVLLFDGGTEPLASFGGKLAGRTADTLRKLGVELHMGTTVTDVYPGGLKVKDSRGREASYDAATVLWTAGVTAPPFASALAQATGAEQDRAGRIAVQDDLTVAGHPEIYVVGDVMSLRELPGVAEVAMQAGHFAGRRIKRLADGHEPGPDFRYRDLGSAAYIARGQAVVSAGKLDLSGFLGWVFWLFIHIAFLTGFRNRIGALLTWWVAFTRDIRRERAITAREIGVLPTVYGPAGPEAGAAGNAGEAGPDARAGRPRRGPDRDDQHP